jgi:tRNA threonylcarbamoyladenosine biosynthesis protein TsaB
MIILILRTDKPDAEIGLYDGEGQLAYEVWQAHRQLAETIHKKLSNLLNKVNKSLNEVEGIVCFKGPGSFTGLRIGLTVANALAYSQTIPVVARTGPNWLEHGIKDMLNGINDNIALPEYGAEANTTKPKK